MSADNNNPDVILANYKRMASECTTIATKIQDLKMEKDEHRLVIDLLKDLEPERKSFRLVGGVLVERTVGEVKPIVEENFTGVSILAI